MGSGSCSPSRGTGGCCRGPTARGERNARRRRPKVRGNGHDDDGRRDGDEVYANAAQRRAHPGVDDDSLIQDTIESIEETCAVGCPFNGHRLFCLSRKVVGPAERSAVGAADRRATVLLRLVDGTDDQPDADCEELDVGDRRCCWYYALPFCLRILTPSVTGSEGETEIRCNVGA